MVPVLIVRLPALIGATKGARFPVTTSCEMNESKVGEIGDLPSNRLSDES